ncbi:hypothetical protein A3J36_03640 [Candidatus Uhrbacteria bacterium RIFCSPLOWO2_02_FULL_54_37]|uniref:Uncharacterized protein n=2 Tax=Candidatus Uhriibacteriota TaxID=1752732 RepID=A0A1F7VJ97_9BACT|nr:MAG: hypothetical protein A3B36_01120 [Candidatus Uhrbacteria bacterium RIFCSPLOWO2_01_FULL_55_36]OGL90580.1 MAG: hypothetical protein A3J36_03640 [Candidatus Uhrbacteria bacterium RIFCSPLOWO2_02_FULL_54_37]
MDEQKFKKLIEKINAMKKTGEIDLSLEEDLSIAVMNLVSLEEHFFFTAEKTGKEDYFDLLNETREIRKALLGRMVDRHEGETWCITKHLLAATMRLIEVGTKLLGEGKKSEAKEMFDRAYRLYALFWGLRLKLISLGEVKKVGEGRLNVHDISPTGAPWSMKDIVNKLVDCCDE